MLALFRRSASRHRGQHAEEQRQEEREVQELRRQRSCQKRRQESEMPALRRDRVQTLIVLNPPAGRSLSPAWPISRSRSRCSFADTAGCAAPARQE